MAFPLEKQKMSMWCWAAVAASVDRFFSPNSSQSQCKIASKVLGVPDCCTDGNPCNVPARLQDALNEIHHLKDVQTHALSFDALKEEIDAGYPVCVRIGWYGGGGHFVTVFGYREHETGERVVEVADPRPTICRMRYEEFVSAYRSGSGEWTRSYLVKQ